MSECFACDYAKNPAYLILETKHWKVYLADNQAYLGRAIVNLKEHKSKLSDLSSEEWADYIEIVKRLEPAYKNAFSAEPLNWGCFMNNAFQNNPPNPHVHWHIFPRYKDTQIINGEEFTDKLYGFFYDDALNRKLSADTYKTIVNQLKATL